MNSFKITGTDGNRVFVDFVINGKTQSEVLDGTRLGATPEDVTAELNRQLAVMVADADSAVVPAEVVDSLIGEVVELAPVVTE